MPLTPYINRHAGATALLFGKGPSLDLWLAGEGIPTTALQGAESIVLALLNDTVIHAEQIVAATLARIAGPCVVHVYCFANDSVAPWVDGYTAGDVLFQPARTLRDPSMQPAAPRCVRVEFFDSGGDIHRLALPIADRAARALVAGHGTSDSAAQILAIMGCARLVAVGCDGMGGRSALPWRTAMRPDHVLDYAALRRDFERVLLRLGLDTEFFPTGQILRRHPTATLVRCTDSVACRGIHYTPGDEITGEAALDAVQVGRAVIEPVPA